MKLTAVPKFLSPYGTIEFVPIHGMPGHTHRVAINGRLEQLWLPREQRPNRTAAEFFMRVWCALQEGLPKYHYADKNVDPALPGKGSEPDAAAALAEASRGDPRGGTNVIQVQPAGAAVANGDRSTA